MQVTKYPQSCLLLTKEDKRILVDPGSFLSNKFLPEDIPEIEAIFVTHRHPDHADSVFISSLLAKKVVPVYANQDTKELLGELVTEVISPAQTVEVASFNIEVYDMPHCLMVDGSEGPPNNGYVFDGIFLHAGDGVSANNLKVDNAAVAIAGPDLSLRDAYNLIVSIGAKKVIPIHYSIFSDEKPSSAVGLITRFTPSTEMIVLDNLESTSL